MEEFYSYCCEFRVGEEYEHNLIRPPIKPTPMHAGVDLQVAQCLIIESHVAMLQHCQSHLRVDGARGLALDLKQPRTCGGDED